MNRSTKQTALNTLNQKWSTKNLPLKPGATQAVPGEGNPNADILFVGEGPGRDEDIQGRPFVGAAGKFLTELIESIGLKREDVFIANMVKHRPPNNRDPLPEELKAYGPWLAQQVEIINPKLIVTLGRYSMAYFLGEGLSISNIHGQPKRRGGRFIMPMYHPAAALYRGNLRPVLAADFGKIPKVLGMIMEGKVEEAQSASTTSYGEARQEAQKSLL